MMLSILSDPQERTRFLKFSVVGAVGAGIDFGVMNALTQVLHASLVVAGTISFLCAVTSNFLWNRFWTYPDSRSRPILQQGLMFLLVSVAGVGIRIPLLRFLEQPIQQRISPFFSPMIASLLAKNVTLAVAIGIVMLWNFFANRYWTYNDV